MNKTLSLTPIANVAEINTTTEYVAVYNGNRYFGKFINASVATFHKGMSFVWNGSIFPQGIPFECLDAVYVTD